MYAKVKQNTVQMENFEFFPEQKFTWDSISIRSSYYQICYTSF